MYKIYIYYKIITFILFIIYFIIIIVTRRKINLFIKTYVNAVIIKKRNFISFRLCFHFRSRFHSYFRFRFRSRFRFRFRFRFRSRSYSRFRFYFRSLKFLNNTL